MATSNGNFLQLFDIKVVISGLNTSNILSSYNFRPFLANLVTFIILLLSATLTQFETSVPPPWLTALLNKICHIYLVTLTFDVPPLPPWL